MTYSIVAREPETGALGVAAQAAYLAVGAVVPWVEPGVGAVVTQAQALRRNGPLGLQLLRSGVSARKVLAALVAADDGRTDRQLAVVDRDGGAAAFTGERCIPAAGHVIGDGVVCLGNLLTEPQIWDVMHLTYLEAKGTFPQRLLAALLAGEAAGGDVRGRQSAALVVDDGEERVDLRVDDHRDPVLELHRLLDLHEGHRHLKRWSHLVEAGDVEAALGVLDRAQVFLGPAHQEANVWRAVLLASLGRVEEARRALWSAARIDRRFADLFARLALLDFVPLDPGWAAAFAKDVERRLRAAR